MKYWVGGGSSENWSATGNTNWSDTDGGANNAAIPTSSDDVTFNGNGNSNSTISATITIKSLTVTSGYTSTMTHNAALTIVNDWNYANSFTISGSSGIIISGTSTITSNGKTWPNTLTLSGITTTYTISGNLTISGSLAVSGRNAVINKTTSETISANGLSVSNANSSTITGTIKVILTGGTLQGSTALRYVAFDIDFAGTITIGNDIGVGGTCTWTYVSGTVTVTLPILVVNFISGTFTMNTNGISWNRIQMTGTSPVISLTSNLTATSLTTSVASTINKTASETATFSNGITINGQLAGTAKIILTGGTWSGSNTVGILNDLDLQGTITVSGNVYYRTGTLRYVSGTITTTSSTLGITASCTLNTSGIIWDKITFTNAATVTLTSSVNQTGLFSTTTNANATLNWTTNETWTCSGGVTYGLNASLAGTSTFIASGGTINTASGGGTTINFNLAGGTITFAGAHFRYATGTLKYVSGTIVSTGVPLDIRGNCTIDTNGMIWDQGTITVGGAVVTLSSLFSVTTFTVTTTTTTLTFAGTAGWEFTTFQGDSIAAITISLKENITYTITQLFSCYKGRLGSIPLFTSSHATLKANILMPNNGSNSCNLLASFTRIDASGGRTIWTYGGTVTDCTNVLSYTDKTYGIAA